MEFGMRSAADVSLDGPWDHGGFTIACSRRLPTDLKADLWSLYEESSGPLRVQAAARQVLTEEEFTAGLDNPRVWKYIALDFRGGLAGLTTLTDDVSTMPWISPDYFEHHYPDEWRRGAVFYVGVALVRSDMRRDQVFSTMAKHVAQRVAAARGIVGYDICGHNDQDRSLGRVARRILDKAADFQVRAVDVQTYYVARATGHGGRNTRE